MEKLSVAGTGDRILFLRSMSGRISLAPVRGAAPTCFERAMTVSGADLPPGRGDPIVW